jgi:hypothetical protein
MRNTLFIYRAYNDISRSVCELEPKESHLTGIVNLDIILRSFLGKLKLLDFPTHIINKNDNLLYYYNNGKPYFDDLITYYEEALALQTSYGGVRIDYIKDIRKILDKNKYRDNASNWSDSMGNVHKFHLLNKNRKWYGRHMLEIRHLALKDDRMFNKNGKPRTLTDKQISGATYVIRQDLEVTA